MESRSLLDYAKQSTCRILLDCAKSLESRSLLDYTKQCTCKSLLDCAKYSGKYTFVGLRNAVHMHASVGLC